MGFPSSRGYFILSRDQERRTRTDDRDPRNRLLSTGFTVILGENCEDIGSGEIIFVDLHTCTKSIVNSSHLGNILYHLPFYQALKVHLEN